MKEGYTNIIHINAMEAEKEGRGYEKRHESEAIQEKKKQKNQRKKGNCHR
jgi:hypothetical protein